VNNTFIKGVNNIPSLNMDREEVENTCWFEQGPNVQQL